MHAQLPKNNQSHDKSQNLRNDGMLGRVVHLALWRHLTRRRLSYPDALRGSIWSRELLRKSGRCRVSSAEFEAKHLKVAEAEHPQPWHVRFRRHPPKNETPTQAACLPGKDSTQLILRPSSNPSWKNQTNPRTALAPMWSQQIKRQRLKQNRSKTS